jgi:superfamily II DNA or RNA helicase
MSPGPTTPYFLPWFADNAKLRGDQFEHLMCWWLQVDPIQQAGADRLVRVIRWEEWSERPNIDLGIDLVGWDRQGRLWAVQCKAYQPESLISKSEVAQLVAEATLKPRGLFHGRIFITSSDGYTENANILAKKNRVLLLDRSHLEVGFHGGSALRWPSSASALRTFLRGKAVARRPAKARPHQKGAVQETLTELARSPRGQLLMACGTGKTLTALWIKEQVLATRKAKQGPARVVVLLPSISLLAQTLREWATNRNTEWAALAVCSDSTTNSSRDENYDDMEAVSAGFPVTTDRASIREFLRSVEKEQIIFSTYQSSAEVAAAARAAKVEFDLVICDEAHRLAGQAGKSYASVLDEKPFPARKRIFMTATPKRFVASAKKKAADEGYAVASMDDLSKFGEVAHQLQFGEAIKKGLLTDYQVVIAVTTDTKARELLEENRFVGLDGKTMTALDLAAAIAVAKAAKRHKITRAISFHSTIKRSKQFVDTLEKLCAAKLPGVPRVLDANHVDGSVSAKERQRRIDRLKAGATGFNLLANARCLTEGVDVPALDGVAFVDPRQSEVDIVQAVGRAIRLSPNKELGTIIVPVVCSAEEVAQGELDTAGHKKLRQVLWALRAHDASLAVEIDNFVFAQALSAGGTRKSGLPEKVKIEFDGEGLKGFAAKIRTSVLKIGSPDAEWAERYAAIKAFRAKHKRWPARRASGAEHALDMWISAQRQAWKKDKLSSERIKRLEALPDWSWDPFSDAWEQGFEAVRAFRAKHKRWPERGASGEEDVLAKWSGVQRREWKKGKLSSERIKRLETIPGWSWDPRADAWERGFDAVRAFRAKHKRWPVKEVVGEEGVLGTWICRQRQAWKKGKLSSERIKRLEGLPDWSWDPFADAWEQGFEAVRAFRAKHKRWPVNWTSGEEGALALWITKQRGLWKKDKLSSERIKRLEGLPDWSWDPFADAWEQNFEDLWAFRAKHKRWPERGASGEEGALAAWTKNQRTAWKNGKLSHERLKRLESIAGWVWSANS